MLSKLKEEAREIYNYFVTDYPGDLLNFCKRNKSLLFLLTIASVLDLPPIFFIAAIILIKAGSNEQD